MKVIDGMQIQAFADSLYREEKAQATIQKYVRAVKSLASYLDGQEITKTALLQYRSMLQLRLKAQTINGVISAINAYLDFSGKPDYKLKLLKVQKMVFLDETRELSRDEYCRLLLAAKEKGRQRLYFVMLTLCATGIRIGELQYITVEGVKAGRVEIHLKGKNRVIVLQKALRTQLMAYIRTCGIQNGPIFLTRNGRCLDRSNICHEMKKISDEAAVDQRKVFPHNLRHLFARSFYAVEKNLTYLADILGHSRLETTRIYVAISASSHERILEQMQLVI